MIWTTVLLLFIAIILIGKGSDWLTDSLIPVAKKLGITGTFVGLILVSTTVSLPVKVYTQEEALEAGLIKKSNSGMYLGIIITLVLIYVIYRQMKKRNRKKKNSQNNNGRN